MGDLVAASPKMGWTKVVGKETLLFYPQENVDKQRECDVLMGSWGPDHGAGKEKGTGSGPGPSSSMASASFVGGICSQGAPSCVEPCKRSPIELSDLERGK